MRKTSLLVLASFLMQTITVPVMGQIAGRSEPVPTSKVAESFTITEPVVSSTDAAYKSTISNLISDYNNKKSIAEYACGNILNSMNDMLGLSTATTVVSGVGTLAAGTALGAGLMKANKDKEIEALELEINSENFSDIDNYLNSLSSSISSKYDNLKSNIVEISDLTNKMKNLENEEYNVEYNKIRDLDLEGFGISQSINAEEEKFNEIVDKMNNFSEEDLSKVEEYKKLIKNKEEEYKKFLLNPDENFAEIANAVTSPNFESYDIEGILNSSNDEILEKTAESKKLGNVRTIGMGVSTVTSLGSTVTNTLNLGIASHLLVDIKECEKNLYELNLKKLELEVEVDPSDDKTKNVIEKANNIISACSGFDTKNITTLKNMSIGSTVSSSIGTVTGLVGTATSLAANSDDIRDDETAAGVKKEKNLNTASNILAGVTMGTSVASTALNAVQISKIKEDLEKAKACSEALAN